MQQRRARPSVEETFGHEVLSIRKERGWSQREFAERLGKAGLEVDASAVSRIERGTRALRLSEAVTISEVLDVHVGVLLHPRQTPMQDFRDARRYATESLDRLQFAAVDCAERFDVVLWMLDEHPQFLDLLRESEEDTSPASVDEFPKWVSARIKDDAEHTRDHYRATSEKDAAGLKAILRSAVEVMVDTRPSHYAPDKKEDDGKHPKTL